MLAAKSALAARVDALGEETSFALGTEHRAYLEARMRQLETGDKKAVSAMKKKFAPQKYDNKSEVRQYQPSQDSNIDRKRKLGEDGQEGKCGNIILIYFLIN
jgi:nucleolar protein 58